MAIFLGDEDEAVRPETQDVGSFFKRRDMFVFVFFLEGEGGNGLEEILFEETCKMENANCSIGNLIVCFICLEGIQKKHLSKGEKNATTKFFIYLYIPLMIR